MKKIFQLLAITFSASLLFVPQVNATIVTQNLGVEVISGPGLGTLGTIDVTYDDALLIGSGIEALQETEINLVLDLFGQIFGNGDDIDYPLFPGVRFLDGAVSYIDYALSENPFGNNPISIIDPTIYTIGVGVGGGGPVVDGVWLVPTTGVPVPEPATFALMGLGLAGIGFSRKRKTA